MAQVAPVGDVHTTRRVVDMPGALPARPQGERPAGGDEPTIGADQPADEQADGRGLARRRRGVARQRRHDATRCLALPGDAVLRGPDEGLGCHPRVRPPAERDEMLPSSGQHRRRPDIVEVLRIGRGRPRPAIRRCPEERPIISVLARRPAGGDVPGAELDHGTGRVAAQVRLGTRPGPARPSSTRPSRDGHPPRTSEPTATNPPGPAATSSSAPGSCPAEPANAEAGSACHVRPSTDVQAAGPLVRPPRSPPRQAVLVRRPPQSSCLLAASPSRVSTCARPVMSIPRRRRRTRRPTRRSPRRSAALPWRPRR